MNVNKKNMKKKKKKNVYICERHSTNTQRRHKKNSGEQRNSNIMRTFKVRYEVR